MSPTLGFILNQLQEISKRNVDERRCPHCGPAAGPAVKHGRYWRCVYFLARKLAIRRYRCRACRATYSVLPFPLLPRVRASLTLLVVGAALGGQLADAAMGRVAQVSRNTVRRWRRRGRWLVAKLRDTAVLTEPGLDWAALGRWLSRLRWPAAGPGAAVHTVCPVPGGAGVCYARASLSNQGESS